MDDVKLWQTVEPADRRLELFDRLAEGRLTVDLEREGLILATTMRQREGTGLQAEMARPGPVPFPPGARLNARFSVGREEYFFRCSPSFHGTKVLLPYPDEVFHLQKRKDFRMVVPADFSARIELTGRDAPLDARVVDLSTSGLGFETSAGEIFRAGEELQGRLRLGARPPVDVGGVVRFVKVQGESQQVGLELDGALGGDRESLQNAIAFFRVDVFHHLYGKP